MIFIPSYFYVLLTFPGFLIHAFLHKIICKYMGLEIREMKYFDFKNKIGYVVHEQTDNLRMNFLISFGPYIIMTIIGLFLIIPTAIVYNSEGETYLVLISLLTIWFSVSILFHSPPSGFDLSSINNYIKEKTKGRSISVLGIRYITDVSWINLVNLYIFLRYVQEIVKVLK